MEGSGPILVVDDEEIVRASLADWLAEDGYEVDTAPDGGTAVAKLVAQDFALLLVDLKMPGMDGLAVLSEARRLRPGTAVVLMTAYATVETAVQAMKQGAQDYLVKPFEPEDLSVMVERVLQPWGAADLSRQAEPAAEIAERPAGSRPAVPPAGDDPAAPLKAVERRHILASLRSHHWNISRTARALGIDRVTLYNKIKRYQIREDE
jgi:DNA-binding NtrC family response regulator